MRVLLFLFKKYVFLNKLEKINLKFVDYNKWAEGKLYHRVKKACVKIKS